MPEYLLVQNGCGMGPTEEEPPKIMAAWGAWLGGLGPAVSTAETLKMPRRP